MLELRNESIMFDDKDEDHEVRITVNGEEEFINSDQAIEIIKHFQK